MTEDHASLVARACRGEDVAIRSLLTRHLPTLEAYVRLRLDATARARESASDLVQSVCREVLENLDGVEYRGEASFRAWLFDVALSKVRDRARFHRAQKRDARREVGMDDSNAPSWGDAYASLVTPSRELQGREALERIEIAVAKLSEDQREVLLLARFAGLSRREIAERTGRSEDSVRGLLQRAVTRLAWELSRPDASGPGAG